MHLVETSGMHLVGQQRAAQLAPVVAQLALVAVLFVLVAEQLIAAAADWL